MESEKVNRLVGECPVNVVTESYEIVQTFPASVHFSK
jgi:hypothetical protein